MTDHSNPNTVPTLADVARLAEVSTATVSRCLNSPDQVVERTRKRVMDAVNTLGYAPNFNARALAAKRTNTIGAIIPTMDNAIFARGIQAFQEALGEHGQTLLVASSSYREDLEEAQIRTLAARGADALLLIGYDRSPEIYDFLRKRNIPTLVAWAFDPSREQLSVGFDNTAAMRDLGQRVLALGHRRIGYISASSATNDRARNRIKGLKLAMSEAGVDPNSLALIETSYGIDTGAAAFRQMMGENRPTVVLCGNDVLAVGAMRAAREMGLRVPQDVSITGFDDMELATLADPELTTVRVPHREMGQRAAQALVQVVSGARVESVQLETKVHMRGTLAPPKAR